MKLPFGPPNLRRTLRRSALLPLPSPSAPPPVGMLCAIGSALGLLSQPASWREGTARSYTPRANPCGKQPPRGFCQFSRPRHSARSSSKRPRSLGQPRQMGRFALAGQQHRLCFPHRCEREDGGTGFQSGQLLRGQAAALVEQPRVVKRSHAAAAHKTRPNAQGGRSALLLPQPSAPLCLKRCAGRSGCAWCLAKSPHLPQITTPLTPAQAVACIAACDDRAP